MFDILTLAFQTDSTRVATLLLAHDGSNRSFSDIGIPEGHHDLSHHFNNEEKMRKVSEIDLWYVKQFASFLRKLDQVQGRRRPFAAAQFHDRLWQRQRRRQPPLARQSAHHSGRRGRRHADAGTPHPAPFGSGGESVSQHGRPHGAANLARFGESTGRLSDV
jgi:hypothetical protein